MAGFRVLVAVGALALAGLLVGLELAAADGELTRDVASESDMPPWTGAISTFGLLVWASAAGACLVSAIAVERGGHREAARFLAATGLLISYLAIDDAFLLHEEIGPYYVGVPQPLFYVLLGMVAAAWAYRFRASIRASDPVLFGTAVAFLGLAVVADVGALLPIPAEDWLKCVGLGAFCAWAADACVRSIDALRRVPEAVAVQ